MAGIKQSSNIVADRYVGSLIDLAAENGALDAVEKDFQDLQAMLASSEDLVSFTRSPLISKKQQIAGLEALATKAKFQPTTVNFLKLLADNRRLNILDAVLAAFDAKIAERRGEVVVRVETAQDLTAAQKKQLQSVLEKETGKQISIHANVNPTILGGMVVTVGSHMIDDSIARKLQRLQSSLSASANENTASALDEAS